MSDPTKPSLIELPPDHPNLPVKPPIVFVVAMLIGFLVDWIKPMPARPDRWSGLGVIFSVVAVGLAVWAVMSLRRRHTDVRPWMPTTAIVTDGPYAFTRNPIYLAFALLLVGVGLWTDKLAVVLMAAPAIAATNNWIIAREEAYLARKFGAPFEHYLTQVRRWM